MNKEKIVHKYNENDIEIIIEIPTENNEEDKKCIEDITRMMNDELLLQLNK